MVIVGKRCHPDTMTDTPLHRDRPPYRPLADRLGLRTYLPDTLRSRLADAGEGDLVAALAVDVAAADLVGELDWADAHLGDVTQSS